MANNSLSRVVWKVSIPIIFIEATETLDHLIDSLFLARVGVTELGAIAEAASRRQVGPFPGVPVEVPSEPWFPLDQKRRHLALRVRPTAASAGGMVTTTPRSGWITTRSPRDRGDRRSV